MFISRFHSNETGSQMGIRKDPVPKLDPKMMCLAASAFISLTLSSSGGVFWG